MVIVMADSVADTFNNYSKNVRDFRHLLKETKRCFKEINQTLDDTVIDKQLDTDIKEREHEFLEKAAISVPCIIILGQSTNAKVAVVNSIFKEEILPIVSVDKEPTWRPIHFRYGSSKAMSVSLELLNSYELVHDRLLKQNGQTKICNQILELSSSDEEIDLANQAALLEVKLRHSMLKDGASVCVSASTRRSSDRGVLSDAMTGCRGNKRVSDASIVVVYALDDHTLTLRDLECLREIQQHHPEVNILFTSVHCTNSREQAEAADVEDEGNQDGLTLTNGGATNHNDCNGTNDYSDSSNDHSSVDTKDNSTPRLSNDQGDTKDNSNTHLSNDQGETKDNSTPHNDNGDSKEYSDGTKDYNSYEVIETSLATESSLVTDSKLSNNNDHKEEFSIFSQLLSLGFLRPSLDKPALMSKSLTKGGSNSELSSSSSSDEYCNLQHSFIIESEYVDDFIEFPATFRTFLNRSYSQRNLQAAEMLHEIHHRVIKSLIMAAYDMARDVMVTPRRIEFAREKEAELHKELTKVALKQRDQLKEIIGNAVSTSREELLVAAGSYNFVGVKIPDSNVITCSKELAACTEEIQHLILSSLNQAIATQLVNSVHVLRDSYTGVLTRCVDSLEMPDTDEVRTTNALKEIVNSAYRVEITVRAGASFARVLLERMKQLMQSMSWRTSAVIDTTWKRKVAADMLDSLSENRLARSICSQIKERLKCAHETFTTALRTLESRHCGRLERTEEQRLRLRKCFAPKVARLVLKSTSLRDVILYGNPIIGKEIGRGQYGVVYSCDKWPTKEKSNLTSKYGQLTYEQCPRAVKTVVPPDERHWNDLALEFYYTKNVPEHDRIVAIRGAIIDASFTMESPAVLLIMDRYRKDLHSAIRKGLSWYNRIQVAIDVVEGIRYLHSLGLVHRDIKLKNVLLDDDNRGKITDLGFCKPEPMMSGSIVGTPIHMAPELFSGQYDSSVDVYAFGVLFWYTCSGHTRLPASYERCSDKEMLWTAVRRGIRPEKFASCRGDCWKLMDACWHGNPTKRPLLGDVLDRLHQIHASDVDTCAPADSRSRSSTERSSTDGDASDEL